MKRVVCLLLVALMVMVGAFVACEAVEEEPIVEEPIVEEPIVEEPIVEEPIVEEPIVEEPAEEEGLPPIQLTMMDVERGGMRISGDDLEPYGIDDIPPVHSPWTITIPQGSTITVTIGVSGHPTAGDHHIIIEGSDPPVDVELGLGEELPPRDLTFNEAGTFKAYSKNLPDELQNTIVVTPGEEEPAPVVEEPAPEVVALPPIELTAITADLGGIRLSGDDLEPYGVDDIPPVLSPWTITIPQGSTITVTIGVSGHPESGDHHIIIEGTDVDVELGVGEVLPPRDLTFNEAGTFKVYSKTLPDELQSTIVVTPGEEEPTPVVEEPAPEVVALPPIRFVIGDVTGEEPMYIRFEGYEGDDVTDVALTAYGFDESTVTSADGPWTITIPQGSTITITQVYVSGRPGTVEHNLTIEGQVLTFPGTDIELTTLGEGEGAGPFELTFNEAGTFKVYCNLHPDAHGECLIVVTPVEEVTPPVVEEPTPEVVALPPINFSIGDTYIRLKGDDLAPYGAELTTPEQESPWTMTIKKGSTITITQVYVSGKPGTLEHTLAIEGTDVEFPTLGEGEGEGIGPYEVTFNEVGTFKVYCKDHPDDHGECLIVVEE